MTDRQTTHAPGCWSWGQRHYECALREIETLQAEVKKLRADLMESDEIREKLGHLLTRTAAALKGEPPAGVWHSWHDLPEKATQLAEALKKVAQSLEWHAHGRCRGFDDEAPLPTNEAVELAEQTLAKVRAEQLAEDDAWCAECGVKLENVRPGKHQHPTCSQAALQRPAAVAQPLTDEALLQQALKALEQGAWDTLCGRNAVAAIRERLEQDEQA